PADNYTKWALDYIHGKNRDAAKPWYLWVCHGSIHGPSTPAKRHKGLYKEAEVPLPADIFPPREGKPDYLNKMQAWAKGEDGHPVAKAGRKAAAASKDGRRFDDWVRQVNECVPAIDESVGQLVAALKETGQYDNTLVIYTADQGFAMGEHGLRIKLAPYDANYASPLIVSMPSRFPTGQVCDVPVNGPDLVATMLAMTGVKVPWPLHGRDLTPLLAQPAAAWPHACYYENMGNEYGAKVSQTILTGAKQDNSHGVPLYSAVVQDKFKFVHYLDGQSGEELYDLQNDPEELKNLIGDPSQAERIAKLREAMKAELTRTEAGFATALK
ncbi:MAG TPA: sulfatase, partial [Verrucomicrobiales bacterium]|nr:sulfatase [Verrucomicrobiales bacterium]